MSDLTQTEEIIDFGFDPTNQPTTITNEEINGTTKWAVWLTDQLTNRPSKQPTNKQTNQPTKRLSPMAMWSLTRIWIYNNVYTLYTQ